MAKGKKRRREEPQETTTRVSLAGQIDITPELVKRLERDLKRNTFNVLTPYTLAQSYNIRISTAKKLLREVAKKGIITLYSGGRNPIYIKASPAA